MRSLFYLYVLDAICEILARSYIFRNPLEGFLHPDTRVTAGVAILMSSFPFGLPHGGHLNATLTSTILLILFNAVFATAGSCAAGR
jgi:membrane protease YdiL (CAAX protease family)